MKANSLKFLDLALAVTHLLAQIAVAQQARDASNLAVPGAPVRRNVTPRIFQAARDIQVVVRLTDAPLATAQGKNAKQRGGKMNSPEQRAYAGELNRKQDAIAAQIRNLGGREEARFNKALNAVVATISPSRIAAIASLPGVLTVRRLRDYDLSLSQSVPYIGARAVQNVGFDGTGVRVAVLDTGIDYTHRSFGGAGTIAAYKAAYGASTSDPKNVRADGFFPTRKVVGGYDLVGESWPDGPLAPDPDPIDCGSFTIDPPCRGGHGTHVADILAGNDSA